MLLEFRQIHKCLHGGHFVRFQPGDFLLQKECRFIGRRKQVNLWFFLDFFVGRFVARIDFVLFKTHQNLTGSTKHVVWKASHFGHMNTIAGIASPFYNFVQEKQFVPIFLDSHLIVFCMIQIFNQSCQFVIMCCKQSNSSPCRFIMQRFNDGPGNGKPVKRTRSTTDFVQKNQTVGSRIAKDVGSFDHFDHEGAETAAQPIAGPYTGKNAVHNANASTFGRDK